MPAASPDQEFADYVVELIRTSGPVRAQRMFGGHGLFREGLMFGLIADGVLYLKADRVTDGEFKRKGLPAFSYLKQGKRFTLSYYQIPDEALDSGGVMRRWADEAYAVALRAAAKQRM